MLDESHQACFSSLVPPAKPKVRNHKGPPKSWSARNIGIDDLHRLQQKSVGHQLFLCARLWNEAAIARLNQESAHELGGFALKASHTAVIPFLTPEGVRISELADRLGVTKQAVSQVVADMEAIGVVDMRPDPADGRAKLVVLTPFGVQAMAHGLSVLAVIERAVERAVGRQVLEQLRRTLCQVIGALERLPVS